MAQTPDDYIYLCHDCLNVYLNESDFDMHRQVSKHPTAAKMKLDAMSDVGKKRILLFELTE